MIFIAGITPKTRMIDEPPRICPSCGLARVQLKRVDHWFSLFFIPVFRVKKGEPFLYCDRCEMPVSEDPLTATDRQDHDETACSGCGQVFGRDHRFCAYCGRPRKHRANK